MTFMELQLSQPLMKALEDLEYLNPTEIQALAIPALMKHTGDFIGQAQTGTGKTGAFVIPLLERLQLDSDEIQAFILAPTRELANQITGEIVKFSKYLDIKVAAVFGGVSYYKQINEIQKGRPQIVVGTPGRTLDLIEKGVLKLDQVKYVVIDEADEMLNMGFLEDVESILAEMEGNRKIWMFSATMPAPILNLIKKRFSATKMVKVDKATISNADIAQNYCLIRPQDFLEGLVRFVETQPDIYGLIFCETREDVKNLAEKLSDRGIGAVALHGDLNQSQRDYTMELFRNKKSKLMVCTDVAARGLDINQITHVINFGVPRQLDSYVHRIGRTGRAGCKGIAITFVSPGQLRQVKVLERIINQKISPYQLPKLAEVKKLKVERDLAKSIALKEKVQALGADFDVDSSFSVFQDFTKELVEREDLLKWMFGMHFGQQLRKINSAGELDAPTTMLDKKRVNVVGHGSYGHGGGGGDRRDYKRRPAPAGRSAPGARPKPRPKFGVRKSGG